MCWHLFYIVGIQVSMKHRMVDRHAIDNIESYTSLFSDNFRISLLMQSSACQALRQPVITSAQIKIHHDPTRWISAPKYHLDLKHSSTPASRGEVLYLYSAREQIDESMRDVPSLNP